MGGDPGPAVVAVFGIFAFMVVRILRMLMEHREKMAAIRGGQNAAGVSGRQDSDRLTRLENELKALRDSATTYDLSFDTALQRLESRVSRIEQTASTPAAQAQQEMSSGT
jgi:hypothetical protein